MAKGAGLAAQMKEACERDGVAAVIHALSDAVLDQSAELLARAGRKGKPPGKGDSPEGGDLEHEANRVLGVYAQLRAAHAVASRS
jgi:hypothetical protein